MKLECIGKTNGLPRPELTEKVFRDNSFTTRKAWQSVDEISRVQTFKDGGWVELG